jgi:outer membrane protein OmpA-like peptidoglycan-associated protein
LKNGIAAVVIFLHVTGCALSSDEEYMRCLQAANTVGSLALVPAGAAAEVIAAGGVGAVSALTLCNEAEITTAPNSLVANVPGDLSQQEVPTAPLQAPKPVPSSEPEVVAMPITTVTSFVFDSRRLQFDVDSADITDGSEATLAPVVTLLRDYPQISIEITGHTCWLGSDEYNLALSEKRADAVADYLVGRGIDAQRLFVTGEGEFKPVESNLTEAGRRSNRRVEIVRR